MNLDNIYQPIQIHLAQLEDDLNQFEDLLKTVSFSSSESTHFKLKEGKKIRAALLLFAAGHPNDMGDAIKAAAAIEMLHFASLVHDDILDQEKERRGEEPVYQQLSLKKALLLGDYIMAQSLLSLPEPIYAKANQALLSIVSEMCVGEFIQQQMKETEMTLPDFKQAYFDVNFKKTALLFGKACAIGSLLNPALSGGHLDSLQKYGENFGMAFQFLDDTLEIVDQLVHASETRVFDAPQGILTLPYLLYAESTLKITTQKEFTTLKRQLASNDHLAQVHQAIRDHNIFSKVSGVIISYLDEAKEALDGVPAELKKDLLRMADYLQEKSQAISLK